MDAHEADNAAFNAETYAIMLAFNDALEADTAATGADINDQFTSDSNAENAAKNAFLDAITEDWAYWLKYVWGYSGYDTSLYANYDDTVDYSRGADGSHTDLGYQGHNGQSTGTQNINGFGYGGIGGQDYLNSEDHLGLAYGSVTGPDSRYFDDSILDAAADLSALAHGYSTSYGKVYW